VAGDDDPLPVALGVGEDVVEPLKLLRNVRVVADSLGVSQAGLFSLTT
jgi:uncharacterized membrane protein